ncbi:12719_t:CDS:2, partial [Entrophospora sp. SA101]
EYEAYFRYREKDFKLVEYLIYHLFYGKITHFNYNEKKEEFYKAYNLYKKKYEGGKPELISEADKMSLEPFINLLVQIKNNFTKSHVLSIRVINKLKEFGWVDINPLENEDVSSAYKRLKMKKIWANNEYKKRSKHINELTFSHDFMETKDRGVLNTIDVLGPFNTDDLNVQEIFFGELSNGPFATDLTHVKNDNTKLGKLGKDSLDRIKRTLFIQDISIILMVNQKYCIPFYRRILISKIKIPMFNTTSKMSFVKFFEESYKLKILLGKFIDDSKSKIYKIQSEINVDNEYDECFETFSTP